MAKANLKNKLQARQNAIEHTDRVKDKNNQKGREEKNDSLIRISHSEEAKSSSNKQTSKQSSKPNAVSMKQSQEQKKKKAFIEEQNAEMKALREAEYEKELDEAPEKALKRDRHNDRKSKIIKRTITGIFIALSVYMAFLTYGIITTSYGYNEQKEVVPIRVSYGEIKDLKEYEVLTTQYFACRSLYESVLLLDCRYELAMQNGSQEELVRLGTEYTKALDTVETLVVQVNSLKLSSKYDYIVEQLSVWIKDYIACYLQFMSSSIINNSQEDYANAMDFRNKTYNGFNIITKNIANVGANISGATDIVDNIDSWSPMKFVQEQGFDF